MMSRPNTTPNLVDNEYKQAQNKISAAYAEMKAAIVEQQNTFYIPPAINYEQEKAPEESGIIMTAEMVAEAESAVTRSSPMKNVEVAYNAPMDIQKEAVRNAKNITYMGKPDEAERERIRQVMEIAAKKQERIQGWGGPPKRRR